MLQIAKSRQHLRVSALGHHDGRVVIRRHDPRKRAQATRNLVEHRSVPRVRRVRAVAAVGGHILFEPCHAKAGRTPDDARVRRCLGRHDFQQARFSRSIHPDERDALAGINPQVSVLEEREMSEGKRDSIEGEERH